MKKTLQWIAGIIFLGVGMVSLSFGGLGILSAIFFVIAGLICLPPTLLIIENKLNTNLKTSTKYILVIVFWVLGAVIIPKQENLKENNIAKSSAEDETEKKDTVLSLKTKLENNIKGLSEDNFTDGKDYTSADQFIIISALYKSYAITINEAKKSKDPEINKLNSELIKKVSQSQVKNFPKIRQKYFEFIKQKLWENDVYVNLSGSRNTNLKFTGAYFATNKNIKTTQEALSEMLDLLRFKKTEYRWYKDQDEYQYYTMQSEKDGDINE
jgi:hypothetical protein